MKRLHFKRYLWSYIYANNHDHLNNFAVELNYKLKVNTF